MQGTMLKEQIETVIIGGGQAGLAMSYHLGRLGCEHLVLERRRIAERWRSERWDSLMFQSPNWNIHLPGFAFRADDPNAFSPRDDVVRFIEHYAAFIRAPLRCGVTVTGLHQKPNSARLIVETEAGRLEASNVVVATGPYQAPAEPLPIAGPVLQIHSSRHRNSQSLPPGAVLVIGTGNSGCQIAEELCHAGRSVYLSVSPHRRTPRRYRGKDCIWWQRALGEADLIVQPGKAPPPARLLTGVGGGHDVDLRGLAKQGVALLGRVLGSDGGKLAIASDLRENVTRGDASLVAFTRQADEHADRNRLDLPPSNEPIEVSPEPKEVADPILNLDVAVAGISTIIWANGFRYAFEWVDLPIFANGSTPSLRVPVHTRGITHVQGVYFLGLSWLHKFKSALLNGVGEDAEHLAEQIAGRVRLCA
jgi:putative flavoprotein involved in K+ transport